MSYNPTSPDRPRTVAKRTRRGPKAPKGKLLLELSAVPNLDFDTPGTWQREVDIRPKYVTVRDFKDASKKSKKFIRNNDLGMGNWSGGSVFDDTGTEVGKVSYNGRVWEPGNYPTKEIKISRELLAVARLLTADNARTSAKLLKWSEYYDLLEYGWIASVERLLKKSGFQKDLAGLILRGRLWDDVEALLEEYKIRDWRTIALATIYLYGSSFDKMGGYISKGQNEPKWLTKVLARSRSVKKESDMLRFKDSLKNLDVRLEDYDTISEPILRGDEEVGTEEVFESAEISVKGKIFYPEELGNVKRVMDARFLEGYLESDISDAMAKVPGAHEIGYGAKVERFKAKRDRRDPNYVNVEVELRMEP